MSKLNIAFGIVDGIFDPEFVRGLAFEKIIRESKR
jgi:hypothetical protein